MPMDLLATKFYIPSPHPDAIPRPHLIEKLNNSLSRKLTLISAPAGFGKTTLISEWIHQDNKKSLFRVAWLSLDRGDNDLVRFLKYFISAIKQVKGITATFGERTMGMLQSAQQPPVESILITLLNEITGISGDFVLVLDDCHFIDSKPIDDVLAFLLDHLPPHIHIVMTSRSDPGFPVSRLRARGEMTELRAGDLRFIEAEAAQFFQKSMHLALSPEHVTALEDRTEGWITGLQMAALAMQKQEDLTSFITSFTGSHRFIMDYLVDEVLSQQEAEVQEFLLSTSILSHMNADLCDAVLGKNSSIISRQLLAKLELHNLFLIPLDDDRQWYRYHHLFADLLQHRLQLKYPEKIDELNHRASSWYEENGLITEALYHAREIKDFDRATRLIVENTRGTIAQGNTNVVFAWINAMPDEWVRTYPLLAIGKAWFYYYQHKLSQIESYLVSAEVALKDSNNVTSQNQRAEILSIRASRARYEDNSHQAIAMCRHALAQMPSDNWFANAMVYYALAGALRTEGETQEAISIYLECIHACTEASHFLLLMGAIHQLHELYVECGRLRDAVRLLQENLDMYSAHEVLPARGLVHAGLGSVAYERNELDQAAAQLRTAVSLSQMDMITMRAQIRLAQVEEIRGDELTKEEILKQTEAILEHWPVNEASAYISAYRACIAVWGGDLAQAHVWKKKSNIQVSTPLAYTNEFQMLVIARLLIADGHLSPPATFFDDALSLLRRIEKMATTAGRFGRVMEAQLLQALAHDAQGNHTEAEQKIHQALSLAEEEGFVRVFVDEGEPMAILLRRLDKRPYITKILAAISNKPHISEKHSDSPPHPGNQPLIEPLSERELEILTMIAAGMKNKEIAAHLFISLNTVHYHTKNLYSKLGVNKRTQAVAIAQELNLL